MKTTTKSATGTSFHDTTIKTTVNNLIQLIGQPDYQYSGDISEEDKVTYEWERETDTGDIITIYDWKEYRPFDKDEVLTFHICGHSKQATEQAKEEILKLSAL